jgi:sugar/nucleoside kinase (ribokinase family)
MRIAVLGEALIDFTSNGALAFQGHPGGSPFNTAVACARLGQPTGLLTQISRDLFGEVLVEHLRGNGVDLRFVLRSEAEERETPRPAPLVEPRLRQQIGSCHGIPRYHRCGGRLKPISSQTRAAAR